MAVTSERGRGTGMVGSHNWRNEECIIAALLNLLAKRTGGIVTMAAL